MSGPTLRQVAERAGVSVITASRILNGGRTAAPVAAGTRAAVEAAARDLGYRTDGLARAVRSGRSGLVGAVIANDRDDPLVNPAVFEYLMGLNAALEEQGLVLSLIRVRDMAPGATVRALEERRFDALVAISHLPAATLARLEALERAGERVVWLDTDSDGATACVGRDEQAVGRLGAGLLIAAGRRQVVWPCRSPEVVASHRSQAARRQGAEAACREAGIPFTALPWESAEERQQAAGPLLELVRAGGVGVLAADPTILRLCQVWFADHRLVPGHEAGLAACDAEAVLARQWPGLSRVDTARLAAARLAAGMVQDLLADPPVMPASRWIPTAVVPGTTA